ncbi:MAG: (2Fe-2S)-binding protein [Rhodoferax sp.]
MIGSILTVATEPHDFQRRLGISDSTTWLNFTFEGQTLQARPGESVAAALLANGIRHWRNAEDGSPRGLYCGVGQCWECRCIIDGRPNVRACTSEVIEGLVVGRQNKQGSVQ